MQIKTNFQQNNMSDPNQPQNRFYMQQMSPAASQTWYDAYIMQVIETTLKAVLTKVRAGPPPAQQDDKYRIMFTPMATEDC